MSFHFISYIFLNLHTRLVMRWMQAFQDDISAKTTESGSLYSDHNNIVITGAINGK